MNLQEWRAKRQQQKTLTLPSGLEVQIKPVTIADLVLQGKVPNTLLSALDDLGDRAKGGTAALKDMSIEDIANMGQLTLIICQAAIAAPEGLDPEELPLDDRIAVFNVANAEAIRLTTFPKAGKAHGVDAASNGGGLRDAAIEPVGV